MSKKFLPVLLVLICGGLFLGYGVMGRGDRKDDNPKTKYERILRNVGIVLEQGHYSPKTIDDKFSQEVLKKYLDDLDPDKYIFYQKDIEDFKKYDSKIDDEIHGAPLESFFAISKNYLTRVDEISKFYKTILSKPFDFTKDESLQLDGDKRNFPVTDAERLDYGRKRLKYLVIGRFVDLQDERNKHVAAKDSIFKKDGAKADSTLEREAREIVSRQMDRYFQTLKNHNTSDDMFSDFVNAITGSMDPHTTYFAPVDKRSFDELLSGTFFGIGAQLKEDDGKIKIASLITGGPAWKSGDIQPEDEIIKVAQGVQEPVDVTGYAVTDAVKLIRGAQKGSEVRLTLKKADGSLKVVPILRDKISLDDTFAKSAIVNGAHKIGYIYLPEFYADFDDPSARRSATDVAKEVEKLKAENVEGIVIDLRGNGGGSLNDVVDMAGLFIKDGPICQVKGRDEKANILSDRDKSVLYTGPLAVMVDELSASASEIFAAAIQDYHRGIVIGSTSTYGKGTVQRSISLDPQAENPLFNSKPSEGLGDIKLTFRKFYRINGGATQLHGVVPDIIIPDRLENVKFREKDNPDALNWDEIPKASYTTWNPGYSFNSVISSVNSEINQSARFKGIRNDVSMLDKYNDNETPLNIVKYRQKLSEIKTTSKSLEDLSKLTSDMNVVSIAKDSIEIVNDKDRIAKNKQFLKKVGTDIYVDETVKVINKIIGEATLAQVNNNHN